MVTLDVTDLSVQELKNN